jgi:hypothetical protein
MPNYGCGSELIKEFVEGIWREDPGFSSLCIIFSMVLYKANPIKKYAFLFGILS